MGNEHDSLKDGESGFYLLSGNYLFRKRIAGIRA